MIFSIEQAGGDVLNYIPDNAYLVVATADAASAIQNIPGVIWLGDYRSTYKLAPEVFESSYVTLPNSLSSRQRVILGCRSRSLFAVHLM